MKKSKIIKSVLFAVAFLVFEKGMSQNDCVDAILICGNANLSGLTASGIGIQEISSGNACSSQENNSLWLKIRINTGGTLGFVLTPQSTNILEDLDFWIFGPNVGCSNLGSTIRCSTTNPFAINQPNNLTGLNSTETDISEGPGFDGNSFIKWMDVLDNETYYIAIDRPTGESAFSISWSGTATFYQPPVPITTNNLQKCGSNSLPERAIFDLTPNTNLSIGTQTNVVTNFYNSYNNAVTNTNPILNTSAYQNNTNPESIYLRLMNVNTGCFAVTDFSLLVISPPITEFSYTTPICINDVNPAFIPMSGFVFGGVFSSTPGLTIDSATGIIDLASSFPGTYTVSYSLQSNPVNCQIATASTFLITVNPVPALALQTAPQPFCVNTPINPLNFNVSGLVTGVEITAGNLPLGLSRSYTNGVFTISGNPAETGIFNYTLTTVGGCSPPASFVGSITVISASVAGAVSGSAAVCTGNNTTELTLSGNVGNLQWQSSTDTVFYSSIVGANAANFTVTNLTATTFYRVMVSSGNCPAATSDIATISVIPLPVAGTVSGGISVCLGTNSTVLTVSGNQGSIEWQTAPDNINFTTIPFQIGTTFTATNLSITTSFRVIVNNGYCAAALSNTVTVSVNPPPVTTLPQDGFICVDDFGNPTSTFTLSTNMSPNTNTFIWFDTIGIISGETRSSYLAIAPGNYSVITTNILTGCVGERATTTINTSLPPLNVVATVSSYFSDLQTVIINVFPDGIYEYKLDNYHFQDNNVFTNLSMGMHEILVRDTFGCGLKKTIFQIINYPNYFTPNGDSYHDTWNILELKNQLNSYISIYDRYGKLLQQIKPSGPGWDGNHNGKPLPATDYWFTVYYTEQNNNEQFSSHFSLLR